MGMIAFESCRNTRKYVHKQSHLAKVLEIPLESVLIHTRCQASHKDFLGALGVDTVQISSRWLFFLWYSLFGLDLAP